MAQLGSRAIKEDQAMRATLALRPLLKKSIDSDIASRTHAHQARVAELKAARLQPSSQLEPRALAPLVLLAHGDSWFDYPLNGNDLALNATDIIVQLQSMGDTHPLILNLSHYGESTTEEMSLTRQQRLIKAIDDKANWANDSAPDAILFSGGGNDIAGTQFCIYLDYDRGLNIQRFLGVLDMTRASYLDLFAFRDAHAPGVPVIGHCYDFPIPNGAHPPCVGPWLQPSLEFTRNQADGTAILHRALADFRQMLASLAADQGNNFILINTQGTLAPPEWANELHPFPGGFQKFASKFVDALGQRFPGRI
jgi:hypothetical protein